MSTTTTLPAPSITRIDSIRDQIENVADQLLASLPAADQLSSDAQRGIIARYSSVLEGNFIYWMTGAYLAVRSEEARAKIAENLFEEVRDSHPHMLRKFEMGADALPTVADTVAVHDDLTKVRLFIGKMQPVPIVTTMAFFEGFIQRFMPYLADLAARRGSKEMVYTDVHGICDVTHTAELYNALEVEMSLDPSHGENSEAMFEGVHLLNALIKTIIGNETSSLRHAN